MNNRIEFKLKTLETIDNTFDQLDKLEQKKDDLNDSLKQRYDEQMASLKKQRAELKMTLEELENNSESNWDETKEIISKSMKHYKSGFEELGKLFK